MNGHIVHRLEPQPEPSADLSPPTSATSARASMSRWVGAQPRWLFSLSHAGRRSMKRAVLLRWCDQGDRRGVAGRCGRCASWLSRGDLLVVGPACRLDYRPDVLIMVAC